MLYINITEGISLSAGFATEEEEDEITSFQPHQAD